MAAQHTRFKAPACDPFCVKFSEFCFCFTTFWYFKIIVHLSFVTKKLHGQKVYMFANSPQ